MTEAKKTRDYDKYKKYGLYQIIKELNTSEKDEQGKTHYHYPELNGHIESLKSRLKEYYANNILKKLFEYELLK